MVVVAVAEAADGFTILEVVIVMVPFFAGSEAAAAERCENENRYGLRTLERSVFGFCFGFRWFKSEDGERDVLSEDEETTGEAVVVVVVIVEAEIEAEVTDGTAIGTAAELLIITAAAARKVREIIEKW